MPAEAVAELRRLAIEHLGDRRLIARAILLALHERRIGPADLGGLWHCLFAATDLRGFFETLLAGLLVTGKSTIDGRWVGRCDRVTAIYPAMAAWMRQACVDRRPALPSVDRTSGMVFISMLLDTFEVHLLSLYAMEEARTVSEVRCRPDEAIDRGRRLRRSGSRVPVVATCRGTADSPRVLARTLRPGRLTSISTAARTPASDWDRADPA